MNELKVVGNTIVNSDGKEVILKGASINEPYTLLIKEHHDFLDDLNHIKKFGFNTVRVPISPAYWQSKSDYIKKALDPIVSFTKKNGLYCILDWHAQGNPKTGETRNIDLVVEGFMKYDARNEIAESALVTLAKMYGKEKHVLFELFSMPNGITWQDWRETAKPWISKIRQYTKAILIINAVNWSTDLGMPLHHPINEKNIAYGVMIYPNFKNFDSVIKVKKKYPIIINECGYTKNSSDPEVFEGNTTQYAIPLKTLISKNKLSWIAWVYHPFGYTSKASVLINSWDPKDLSAWGKFVKKELL
ncbi:MAG: cellulase family glycosylhydrolase [Candidatus Woesearchaeota archaeon]